jgi:hypothetical protein
MCNDCYGHRKWLPIGSDIRITSAEELVEAGEKITAELNKLEPLRFHSGVFEGKFETTAGRIEPLPDGAFHGKNSIEETLKEEGYLQPELTAGGYPNPLHIHDELCRAGKEIMMKKNHDYTGGSGDPYANFRGSTSLGIPNITGILLRVQDKMMRIKTFEEKGELKVAGEGIKDALIDVINYMVLIGGLVKEIENENEKVSSTEESPRCECDATECGVPDSL